VDHKPTLTHLFDFAMDSMHHRLTLESCQWHTVTCCSSRVLATTWGGKARPIAAAADGQRWTLWRQFFSNPLQWWDCRLEKVDVNYPGFQHKKHSKDSGLRINETLCGYEQSWLPWHQALYNWTTFHGIECL
jgi:hypothetical protein